MKVKQVLVWRKDLKVRKGKFAAQMAHASMKVFFDRMSLSHVESLPLYAMVMDEENSDEDREMMEWIKGIFTKICVSVDSEEELISVYEKAKESGLPCAMITDAGLTEFNGVPTKTAVAIGPAAAEKIDPITGGLKLL